jgi:dihydroorotase/N-acyl-D-amino-acid deacylase
MPELLELVRSARADGVEAWADAYPYASYETELASFVPAWAPIAALPTLLSSRADRQRLRSAVEEGEPDWQSSIAGVGWDRIVVDHHADRSYVGRTLAELAAGSDPLDLLVRLLVEDPQTLVIGQAMREDDVRTAVAAEDVMVASDGVAVPTEGPLSRLTLHPRCWGTFPRVLGHYVRAEGLLSLPTAVRCMTSLPAERFGFRDRGVLRAGAFADLVVLDPGTVAGPADFGQAALPPLGIDVVVVNGAVVWSEGRHTAQAGRVLR